ncbi:MAG: flagellar biosynthesis protein FlhB [Nitrosomonas sp.]|nr:flagellar biosynthesis protein FlhB [Nitrosomonas sp.]MDP1950028.1 flagellar biosynthesis protein FlhB [Nitrosomonas sp.]
MAEESDLERTEPATPKRIEKSREDGQVARSQELTTFTVMIAAATGLWFLGSNLIDDLSNIVRNGMKLDRDIAFDSHLMLNRLFELAVDGLWALGPLFVLLVIAAFFAPMLLSGWLFSSKAVIPDFKRLNPVSWFKRVFSVRGLIELVKAIAKSLVIGGMAVMVIWNNKDAFFALIKQPVDLGISHMGEMLGFSFILLVCAMLLIVAIDVPFQIWEHAENLKMSKEDVRKENKDTEGDPYVKARIRNLQREAARRRMMSEVPKADVIVTNPTHYSIALKYQGDTMRAPRVVAKGVHLLAARIRELAEENRIPILEAPPLARALYHHAELDSEIPETLYTAVAEILAYVFQLRRYQEYGGAMPELPVDVPVPEGLDHA